MEWWTIIHGFPMLGRSMDHNSQSNYMTLTWKSLLQSVINLCLVISNTNTNTNTIILVPHTSTAFVSHHRTSPFSPSALSLSSSPSPYLPPFAPSSRISRCSHRLFPLHQYPLSFSTGINLDFLSRESTLTSLTVAQSLT